MGIGPLPGVASRKEEEVREEGEGRQLVKARDYRVQPVHHLGYGLVH